MRAPKSAILRSIIVIVPRIKINSSSSRLLLPSWIIRATGLIIMDPWMESCCFGLRHCYRRSNRKATCRRSGSEIRDNPFVRKKDPNGSCKVKFLSLSLSLSHLRVINKISFRIDRDFGFLDRELREIGVWDESFIKNREIEMKSRFEAYGGVYIF